MPASLISVNTSIGFIYDIRGSACLRMSNVLLYYLGSEHNRPDENVEVSDVIDSKCLINSKLNPMGVSKFSNAMMIVWGRCKSIVAKETLTLVPGWVTTS